MMKIKSLLLRSIVTALFLFLLAGVFTPVAKAAPRLYFDPSPVTLINGVESTINLKIDAESTSVFGADAEINFPTNDVTITSVTNGGFFSDFSYAPSSGKLEIHSFFGNSFDSKSGSGTVAVIKLKTNKDTGAGQLTFTCGNGGQTEILKASDGSNILSCSSLTSLTLAYGSASGTNNNSGGTDNNTGNTQNTNDPNATNACGGTCGSNYNCNVGLYCYAGFCRNPDCPTSLTCSSTCPTTKPTIKPTFKPIVKSTPQVVILVKSTATPSGTPNIAAEETPAPANSNGLDLKKIGIWTGIIILSIAIISIIASLFKSKDNPPKITPPTTITNVEPPLPVSSEETQPGAWTNPENPTPPETPPPTFT